MLAASVASAVEEAAHWVGDHLEDSVEDHMLAAAVASAVEEAAPSVGVSVEDHMLGAALFLVATSEAAVQEPRQDSAQATVRPPTTL